MGVARLIDSRSILRLPLPAPYVPTRTEALRDRLRRRPNQPDKAPRAARDKKSSTKTKPRKPQPARHPVRSGRPSGGYGDTQRNQGRRARTLEGQRYG